MDKQLRQRAGAGGIEKIHTTHIKNQLGVRAPDACPEENDCPFGI